MWALNFAIQTFCINYRKKYRVHRILITVNKRDFKVCEIWFSCLYTDIYLSRLIGNLQYYISDYIHLRKYNDYVLASGNKYFTITLYKSFLFQRVRILPLISALWIHTCYKGLTGDLHIEWI